MIPNCYFAIRYWGDWLLAIGYSRLAIGYWLLVIGSLLLAIAYWRLAIGYLLLAIGYCYWLLAIGVWRLAVGYDLIWCSQVWLRAGGPGAKRVELKQGIWLPPSLQLLTYFLQNFTLLVQFFCGIGYIKVCIDSPRNKASTLACFLVAVSLVVVRPHSCFVALWVCRLHPCHSAVVWSTMRSWIQIRLSDGQNLDSNLDSKFGLNPNKGGEGRPSSPLFWFKPNFEFK